MAGKMDTKVRKVRCPRCRGILTEPPDVLLYECGGCGTKLQAKKRNNSAVVTTSQRPGDDSAGKQKVEQVFVDPEAASSSNQQSMLNSTNESDQISDHNDLHSSNKDQDAAKIPENATVPAPPSVVGEYSSEKLKIKQLSDTQEPYCSSKEQSFVNSSKPDQNIHLDQEQEQEQNQKQDQSHHQENGTAVGEQKIEQLLVNSMNELDENNDLNKHSSSSKLSYHDSPKSSPEATVHDRIKRYETDFVSNEHSSSSKLSYHDRPNSSPEATVHDRVKRYEIDFVSNEPDQNIHNDPCSSIEFSGHEDPESSPEATSDNILDQEQKQEQDQSHLQYASKQQEIVTIVGLEHSSGKQKIEQLSDDNETNSSLTQPLFINSMNGLDRNKDGNEHLSSSDLSYHDDPDSSPEAAAQNIIDQKQQEQNQITEQFSDDPESGSSLTHLLLVNSMNELERNNDLNEHLSSSELSYHNDLDESWPNRGKQQETEFVSCRNETEIEDRSSELKEAIANTRIIIDSNGGSKSSFRSMIAEKLLDTRQKKPVYLDEDDLLSEDGSADLRHRRRLGRISSEESIETARFAGTSYYEYEGSVSSIDGNDNQNPRKHHTGSIRDKHVDSGRYHFNRRNVRSIYGLNEFRENPRHHRSPMIPENPNLERIELLKLVRELQEQLEIRKNVSYLQQARYDQRMAFSGEATAVNRRRDGCSCHHCYPQPLDRHFSAQLPHHHDCCNGLNYRPNNYHSPRFSGPSSPKHNRSTRSGSDFSAPDDHWQRKPVRSPKKKRYVRPIAGGSPWIACYLCSKLLELPQSFLLFNKRYHSLRCGSCLKVLNFTLSNGTHVSRYYPEEMIAAPPSSEVEDFDTFAGPVSCSDRSFEKSYSTETDRYGSRELSEERRKATMSRDPSSSTRPPSSKVAGRRTGTSEIEKAEPGKNGSPLHWLMGYASPSKVIRGL